MDKMNPGVPLNLKILCFYSSDLTVSLWGGGMYVVQARSKAGLVFPFLRWKNEGPRRMGGLPKVSTGY